MADRSERTANTMGVARSFSTSMRFLIIGFASRHAFVEQRCILLKIEKASFWMTMFFLPADNGGTGRFVKFSVEPSLKPSLVSSRWVLRRCVLVRPILSSVSWFVSSEIVAVSTEADCSRGVVLNPPSFGKVCLQRLPQSPIRESRHAWPVSPEPIDGLFKDAWQRLAKDRWFRRVSAIVTLCRTATASEQHSLAHCSRCLYREASGEKPSSLYVGGGHGS
jgi:hypothetical protein